MTQGEASKEDDSTTESRQMWKLMPSSVEAREKYEKDGTLTKSSSSGHLELRLLLDDMLAQQALGAFAKKCQSLDIFMCWIDIQEFKSIPTPDYRRSKALHIYHKYIKAGAVLEIGGMDEVERDAFKDVLDKCRQDPGVLLPTLYDKLQYSCFVAVWHNIFIPFRDQTDYINLSRKLKAKYNCVRVEDFQFIGKLGEGGFGLVVHAKKRSTGKHYAIKIQTKYGLLDSFQDDPWRADFEKQAFACCRHPFIVGLDYAFQNEQFAFMVLTLSTAGDLSQQLQYSPNGCLPENRVRFYAAEICLALIYLHDMGLIYRDLKPNNVLLNADGHIQLVDLGGVVDERGETLGKADDATQLLLPLLQKNYTSSSNGAYLSASAGGVASTSTNSGDDNHPLGGLAPPSFDTSCGEDEGEEGGDQLGELKPKRKLSIMGTFGYMAPEMVIMMTQMQHEIQGYNDSVDWWSLGCTVFKLLTGARPFTQDKFQAFVDICGTMTRQIADHAPEYAMLFQEVRYPSYMSPEAVDFCEKLLDVNDNTRLGSGPGGVRALKAHPFFDGIDWELLEQRHMEPPYKPKASFDDVQEEEKWPSFDAMMVDLGKEKLMRQQISEDKQKYFANWDFVSPYTMRVEVGIEQQMQQYDSNFKVRKLLGETASPSASTRKSSILMKI